MKTKTALSVALLAFVAASLAWMAVKERGSAKATETPAAQALETTPAPATPASEAAAQPRKIIAYYLHGNARCPTCMKIEATTDKAIHGEFESALDEGVLEWKVVNIDEPENNHFVADFQLYTKSVVLVELQGDKQVRWKNLEKIWELVHDEDAFIAYIRDEVKGFLKPPSAPA